MHKRSILLVTAILALSATAAFGGVYRWVDAEGVVHYSDTPPPGVHATRLGIETSPTDPATVAADKKQRETKLKKLDQQQQVTAKAQTKTAQQKKAAQAACAKAQSHAKSLAGIDRLRRTGADGKVTYLSGDDLAQYKQTARDHAKKLCAGG